MTKKLIFSGIVLVSFLTLALFHIKYKVVQLENEIESINREIFAVEESIHILMAEWAYRSSPYRITSLSASYLPLTLTQPHQFQTTSSEETPPQDETSFTSIAITERRHP